MVQIAGKYIVEKNENFSEYLKGLGLNEEQLKGALNANKELEIKANGSEYTIVSGIGARSFPLDKEVDEKFSEDNVVKSTASLSGNKLTIKSVGKDGKSGLRVYEASDSGLVLTLSTEGVGSAKIYFKRA